MSWLDKAGKIIITITRKDGDKIVSRNFTGLVRVQSYSGEMEFNATEYTFIDVHGELVKKRKLLKQDFELEFYFQGANHLDESSDFREWAFSEIPWVINHPYYGVITCQVIKLKFDNTELNLTKWTGTAIETIENVPLVADLTNISDIITLKTNQVTAIVTAAPDITPSFQDVDNLKTLTRTNYNAAIPIIKIPEEAQDYFNTFNDAITAINAITESPILAMAALNAVILAPFQFTAAVNDRMNVLINQFNRLRNTVLGITSRTQKRLYEVQGAGFLSAICAAAATPQQGNYINATRVLFSIARLRTARAGFQADIDAIKSPNGNDPLFYVPSFDLIKALDDLVNTTISKLYVIALGGRREFSYTLLEDANVVTLTHRFYGLDNQDANVKEFKGNNQLTYKEIALGVPRGKTIIYYI